MIEPKKYYGHLVKQRETEGSPQFFIFNTKVSEIVKWAGFKRTEEFADGTQRAYRATRLDSIAKFLRSNPINTIPNNILIAFDHQGDELVSFTPIDNNIVQEIDGDITNGCGNSVQWGFITFDHETEYETPANEHLKPALVIDGQHRLLGISKQDEDIPILVVSILNCSPAEQAFQFIVINNKAVKVPTQNVKGIISDFAAIEGELNERLLQAGVAFGKKSPLLHEIDNDEVSPFRNLLDWPSNRDGTKLVPLTAVEQCISLYKNTFNKIKDDEDSQREILFAIFNEVKRKYGDEIWGQSNNYLMKKVSLNALNELFVERFKFMLEYRTLDLFNSENISLRTREIINKIPSGFWTTNWTIGEGENPLNVQDNSNVRTLIKKDLELIIENKNNERDWFEKLKLIKPNDSLIEAEEEE